MNFDLATLQVHKDKELRLKERSAAARTIPGMQKLHCFRPVSTDMVEVKQFSECNHSQQERVNR